jgi:hypothetical protein
LLASLPREYPDSLRISRPQLAEELPDVVDEQIERHLGGVVTTTVVDMPGDNVLVVTLGKRSDRLKVEPVFAEGGRGAA